MAQKRLFNDPYLAYTDEAEGLAKAVRAALEAFHRGHPDVDLRDATTVASQAVGTYYAEQVILRATRLRKKAGEG